MKHLFVPYEIARQLKEKGYNEQDLAYYIMAYDEEKEPFNNTELEFFRERYDNHNFRLEIHPSSHGAICTAPLFQQVIDWFREKHNITIEPYSMLKGIRKATFETVYRVQKWHNPKGYRDFNHPTLTKAIKEALKLI